MPNTRFGQIVIALAAACMATLAVVVLPTFVADGLDIGRAFDLAVVNPYASGFATDVFFTYAILITWVVYEAKYRDVRHGWVAVVLGLLLSVALGLALYLLIRHRDLGPQDWR
jgi:hypothetical protein